MRLPRQLIGVHRPFRRGAGWVTAGTIAVSLIAALPAGAHTRTNRKADIAIARRELLPAVAYPTAFKAQGPNSRVTGASFFGGASASVVAELTTCIGISVRNVDTAPVEAASQEYVLPRPLLTINDSVEVFPTTKDAIADVRAAANTNTPKCFVRLGGSPTTQSVIKAFGPGSKVGQMTAIDGLVTDHGDHGADLIISLPITFHGAHHTFYQENVLVQKGRSESSLRFTSMDTPPSLPTVNAFAHSAAIWMSHAH